MHLSFMTSGISDELTIMFLLEVYFSPLATRSIKDANDYLVPDQLLVGDVFVLDDHVYVLPKVRV